jgi:hypothetical protein
MRKQPCIYCGKRNGDTDDHVPPRSIFPRPRPGNLVTVPACRECNEGFSDSDDLFALFVCLQAGMEGPRQLALHAKVKRGVQKNQRFQRLIRAASPDIPLLGRDGSIAELVRLIPWDSRFVKSSIERIVVGLAFHHYGVRVCESGFVEVYLPQRHVMKAPQILDVLQHCLWSRIGHEDEFIYRHGTAEDSLLTSVWELTIYRTLTVVAVVMPLV